MNKHFKKIKAKYEKDGLALTIKKIYTFLTAYTVRYLTYNRSNQKKWKALKDAYKGKRVFLIGNGPSLNETPLYMLKNEYAICFNRVNILFERLAWRPEFYACVDGTVVQDNADEINKLILPEVKHAFFTDFHMFQFDNIKKQIDNRPNVQWLYSGVSSFSVDMPKIGPCPTVALAALQILPYLGFSEIYILGMDMNYKIHTTVKEMEHNQIQSEDDDDPNHFDPRYFGKGKKYHQPTASVMDNTFKALENAREKLKQLTTTKVYNATYGGIMEVFERVGFDTLFTSYTEQEKFDLFADSFRPIFPVKTFDELNEKVETLVDVEEDQLKQLTHFMLNKAEFLKKSGKLIFDYIPYGPYQDKYLLIKR
ncbi:6-hydroxymethylpterin diphosphokinase MptE-like protein [Mucilaginibacter celer]|uniref:DUF115 domain-containing protein n=1 Tax=Mucilaginibacter celer TaxID=2305508 RepID=A0A494VRN5_9SPHI|nr:6-hydroxymethylpterin diphosphokinase MptE-like protein [Mucilaginibacter celer]AYL97119.1 DUF115 domain-containing protein [Mucilaginibacter celer]